MSKVRPRWYDVECVNSQKEVDCAYKQVILSNFQDESRIKFVALRKHHCNLLKFKKCSFFEDITGRFSQVTDTINFWRTVRYARGFSPPCFLVSLKEWSSFYQEIFPPRSPDFLLFQGPYDPMLDSPIRLDEVIYQIRASKSGKAPGDDGIASDFYKHLPGN